MNKDFWDKVKRLEELAKNTKHSDIVAFLPTDNSMRVWADYIAAANPAMIQEMIAKLKRLHEEIEFQEKRSKAQGAMIGRLEKEADWLADILQRHSTFFTTEKWRKAARRAVSEKNNA